MEDSQTAKCENCGFEPYEDDKYCRRCGNQLNLICEECEAEVEAEDKFCHSCGAELGEVVEDSEPEEQPAQQTQVNQGF